MSYHIAKAGEAYMIVEPSLKQYMKDVVFCKLGEKPIKILNVKSHKNMATNCEIVLAQKLVLLALPLS